jgi:tRNA1(Val) A37 N6-methylase TrmN6
VLEAGCGTGAAFLCLAARVSGLSVAAVEREPSLVSLARSNADVNGVVSVVMEGDVADHSLARALGPCDHAFANPPYWSRGTESPAALRRAATHEAGVGLDAWVRFLVAGVRAGGSVSLILPAERFDAGVAALRSAGCGGMRILPVAPRAGMPAKRCLLQARKSGRGHASILAALELHAPDGAFTTEAEAVMRDAAPLAQR